MLTEFDMNSPGAMERAEFRALDDGSWTYEKSLDPAAYEQAGFDWIADDTFRIDDTPRFGGKCGGKCGGECGGKCGEGKTPCGDRGTLRSDQTLTSKPSVDGAIRQALHADLMAREPRLTSDSVDELIENAYFELASNLNSGVSGNLNDVSMLTLLNFADPVPDKLYDTIQEMLRSERVDISPWLLQSVFTAITTDRIAIRARSRALNSPNSGTLDSFSNEKYDYCIKEGRSLAGCGLTIERNFRKKYATCTPTSYLCSLPDACITFLIPETGVCFCKCLKPEDRRPPREKAPEWRPAPIPGRVPDWLPERNPERPPPKIDWEKLRKIVKWTLFGIGVVLVGIVIAKSPVVVREGLKIILRPHPHP